MNKIFISVGVSIVTGVVGFVAGRAYQKKKFEKMYILDEGDNDESGNGTDNASVTEDVKPEQKEEELTEEELEERFEKEKDEYEELIDALNYAEENFDYVEMERLDQQLLNKLVADGIRIVSENELGAYTQWDTIYYHIILNEEGYNKAYETRTGDYVTDYLEDSEEYEEEHAPSDFIALFGMHYDELVSYAKNHNDSVCICNPETLEYYKVVLMEG